MRLFKIKIRCGLLAIIFCLLPFLPAMAQMYDCGRYNEAGGCLRYNDDPIWSYIENGLAPPELERQTQEWNAWLENFNAVAAIVSENQALGRVTDWDEVADSLGIARGSPDDIAYKFEELKKSAALLDAYNDWLAGGMDSVDPGMQNAVRDLLDSARGGYDYDICNDPGLPNACRMVAYDKINEQVKSIQGAAPVTPPPVEDSNPNLGNAGDDATGSFFDVSYMLSQIERQIPALIRLVIAIGYLSGFIMLVLAIMKLKAYGQQTVMSSQHAQLGPSMAYFVFGTILMFLPSMVTIATNSIMVGGGDAAYSYSAGTSDFGYAQLFSAIIAIIRLVGYIAFLRGWLILSKTGGHGAQPGNLGKGIIHVIGGILAINIVATWEIVRASFGFVW